MQKSSNSPSTCRFGFMYAPVSPDRKVIGLIPSDTSNLNTRAKKRFAREKNRVVDRNVLISAIEKSKDLVPQLAVDLKRQRDMLLAELKTDPDLLSSVADKLRNEVEENFSQSHDFLQLVKTIRGHSEVLLRQKHPDKDPGEAAEIEKIEGAIYFATTLMAYKVDSMVFVNDVSKARTNEKTFQIHPLLLKHVRIYDWQASQKGLNIRVTGACSATCYYNFEAIISVMHGLLDNMVKYAPANSKATINFVEGDEKVQITFSSLGPRIAPEESREIFLPGVRGANTLEKSVPGQGLGLAIVKSVSDELSLNVNVDQNEKEDNFYRDYYLTNFSFDLRKIR